ncbi:unnamed protein product, partial [Pleuronectes platessa]
MYVSTLTPSCTWFEHVSMLVILLNCVTLGMFQPCEDVLCQAEWCRILQVLDDCIFAFFAVEMVIKMVALGIFGPNCYLGDKWNQLDFVIVMAGVMEYSLDGHNASLSAIRTVRVLRPLRAINRVPKQLWSISDPELQHLQMYPSRKITIPADIQSCWFKFFRISPAYQSVSILAVTQGGRGAGRKSNEDDTGRCYLGLGTR